MCVCVGMCVCECNASRGQRQWIVLELELQSVVSHCKELLESKLSPLEKCLPLTTGSYFLILYPSPSLLAPPL